MLRAREVYLLAHARIKDEREAATIFVHNETLTYLERRISRTQASFGPAMQQ